MAYKCNDTARLWRQKNKDRLNVLRRKWRALHAERDRDKNRLYNAHYQRTHRAQKAASARRYRARFPAYSKQLMTRYGLTIDDYNAMLSGQSDACAICYRRKADSRLVVDHDHATRKVRGILCHECNCGIGAFYDNSCLMLSAIMYLTQKEPLPGDAFLRNDKREYQNDARDRKAWARYGVSYHALSTNQGACCAICKTPASGRRLHIDHNHVTNKIRGLLCFGCNAGIGYFKDSCTILHNAVEYLGTIS